MMGKSEILHGPEQEIAAWLRIFYLHRKIGPKTTRILQSLEGRHFFGHEGADAAGPDHGDGARSERLGDAFLDLSFR